MLEGFQFLKLQKLLVSNESFWASKIVAFLETKSMLATSSGCWWYIRAFLFKFEYFFNILNVTNNVSVKIYGILLCNNLANKGFKKLAH